MATVLKVFCKGREQAAVAARYSVIERYEAFVVLSVSKDDALRIRRQLPVEDITTCYTIEAGGKKIDTRRPRIDAQGQIHPHPYYRGMKAPSPGRRHHYLVQFIGPIKAAWLRGVARAGGELRTPYSGFVYVVRGSGRAIGRIAALPYVRWVGHLPFAARISSSVAAELGLRKAPTARSLPRTRLLPAALTVEFYGPRDATAGAKEAQAIGFRVLLRRDRVLVVQLRRGEPKKMIAALSAVGGVKVIRERVIKRPSNDVAAQIMGTKRSLKPTALGLSGRGEVVAVCDTGIDTGDPQTIHRDFQGRMAWVKSYPITDDYAPYIHNPGGNDGPADQDSGHGTHVAGSAVGSGSASVDLEFAAPVRGLAYNAKLVFQAVEQELEWKREEDRQRNGRFLLAGIPADMTDLLADAYERGARIHSNSWGGGAPGAYDAQCEQLDRFVWEHPDLCVLVASGNDGTDHDGDGQINPMSVTSPATAKNCITVGACESVRSEFVEETYGEWWEDDYPAPPFRDDPMADDSRQVVAFSSRGPTRDGRVKPEVIAPGTYILSTRSTQIAPNNFGWAASPPAQGLYFYMGGTSMATPLVAGAAAIVREYLRKKARIARPSAALIKAALILGAKRLAGVGTPSTAFDNDQGFGRVHLDRAIAPARPAVSRFVNARVKLWTGDSYPRQFDVRSDRVPLKMVLAYSDYPGLALVNNLNLIARSPEGRIYAGNRPAGGTLDMDTANNVEVIEVARPAAGRWRIVVVASNVPHGPQGFALACRGDLRV